MKKLLERITQMEQDTHLSNVMDTIRDSRLDEACKRILSFKIIPAHILKACLEEFKDVNDIAEKYIEGKPTVSKENVYRDEGNIIEGKNTEDNSVNEGLAGYDILFYVYLPKEDEHIKMIINIEAQGTVKDIRTPLTLRTHNRQLLTKPLYSAGACTPTEYNSKTTA